MNSTISYKRTEVIGRGKFGVVYKGYHKHTKQVVAIKVLNLDTQEDEVADVQQEIQFLTELKSVPNVTHYYGSFLIDTKLWIIMDYCAGGSVRTLLRSGIFEERYIGVIVRELSMALQAVHKLGVIHRDLKAANVLITNEGNVQLCDFGVAAKITSNSSKRSTMVGTPYWMAPEVIREGDTYNVKADIWSLGITVYEIATGNPPYCDKEAMWAMQMISKSTPPRLEGREHSSLLKECVALCLDENPDERPSAEDLLKCKLVKTYKNHTTVILKELITRYLLWRDRNSSRDSVVMNLDEDANKNDAEHLHVKWDFDSLSSKEYIIENDIDIEKVDNNFSYEEDTETYRTQPTLQGGSKFNTDNNFTISMNNTSTISRTMNNSQNEIPKSLLSLFEENESSPNNSSIDMSSGYEVPPATNFSNRGESLTIEIPDMDNLANSGTGNKSSSNIAGLNASHPPLSKPPVLYHSQSASGNLESRFSTTSSVSQLPRKKTISNSFGSISSNANQQTTPHTPPYSNSISNINTPSPKPPSSSGIVNSAGNFNTVSPSKSMKALHSNSNPLLQPINFKLTGESTNQSTATSASQVPQYQTTTNSTTNLSSNLQKKVRPSLHIQMPTPSNYLNNLSALTNGEFENSQQDGNVNQFGINPAHVANIPLTMTPVTEKNQPLTSSLNNDGSNNENEPETSHRERAESLTSQRHYGIQTKKMSSSNLSNTASNVNASSHNLFLPRSSSLSSASPSILSNGATKVKFPNIPSINGEFFLDGAPKQNLINELDTMIKLFNQGLEAFEDNF